jgi:hypothetical protein
MANEKDLKRPGRRVEMHLPGMIKTFVSSLTASESLERIKSISDPLEVDPSSPNYYCGTRPILISVRGERFRLLRRTRMPWFWWLLTPVSWFKPHLAGRLLPREDGSELELEGGAHLGFKIAWVLALLALPSLVAILTVFHYPVDINFDPTGGGEHIKVGVAIMNLLVAVLLVVPAIGWFLNRNDLFFLIAELKKALPLKEVPLR